MTGVTGYIGFQTLTIALERGYSVCAIVRRQRDVVSLRTKSPLIATREDQGRLAFAIIPNLLDTGAILQHLDGITAIIHLASPLGSQVRLPSHDIRNTNEHGRKQTMSAQLLHQQSIWSQLFSKQLPRSHLSRGSS